VLLLPPLLLLPAGILRVSLLQGTHSSQDTPGSAGDTGARRAASSLSSLSSSSGSGVAMTAQLRAGVEEDEGGGSVTVAVAVEENVVSYALEWPGVTGETGETGEEEVVSVTFLYREDHGDAVETHYLHRLQLEGGQKGGSFTVSDAAADLLVGESVTVTVSHPSGELSGALRLE
jgi:hypothetical protein